MSVEVVAVTVVIVQYEKDVVVDAYWHVPNRCSGISSHW